MMSYADFINPETRIIEDFYIDWLDNLEPPLDSLVLYPKRKNNIGLYYARIVNYGNQNLYVPFIYLNSLIDIHRNGVKGS